jgi:hypothetical protein
MNDTYDLEMAIRYLARTIDNFSEKIESKDELGELGELSEFKIENGRMTEKHIPIYKSYEATLLGCLMLDNNAFGEADKRVQGCHFATQRHRNIFRAMKRLHHNKKPIDTISVLEELERSNQADSGIESYLFNLAKNVFNEGMPHLATIANIVWSDAKQRERDDAT